MALALFIELSDVAGAQPELAHDPQGLLGTLPVALEQDVGLQRPRLDLPRLVGAALAIVAVEKIARLLIAEAGVGVVVFAGKVRRRWQSR